MGRRGAGGADASATDPDDVLCIHPWRCPARDRNRRGRRNASGARHGGLLRHARRDFLRPDFHTGVLCARALDRLNSGIRCSI